MNSLDKENLIKKEFLSFENVIKIEKKFKKVINNDNLNLIKESDNKIDNLIDEKDCEKLFFSMTNIKLNEVLNKIRIVKEPFNYNNYDTKKILKIKNLFLNNQSKLKEKTFDFKQLKIKNDYTEESKLNTKEVNFLAQNSSELGATIRTKKLDFGFESNLNNKSIINKIKNEKNMPDNKSMNKGEVISRTYKNRSSIEMDFYSKKILFQYNNQENHQKLPKNQLKNIISWNCDDNGLNNNIKDEILDTMVRGKHFDIHISPLKNKRKLKPLKIKNPNSNVKYNSSEFNLDFCSKLPTYYLYGFNSTIDFNDHKNKNKRISKNKIIKNHKNSYINKEAEVQTNNYSLSKNYNFEEINCKTKEEQNSEITNYKKNVTSLKIYSSIESKNDFESIKELFNEKEETPFQLLSMRNLKLNNLKLQSNQLIKSFSSIDIN